jgi:hypothetical protein
MANSAWKSGKSAPLDVPGALRYFDLPATRAIVRVVPRGRRQRILRAAGVLVACWGIGVVSILIPLLHFILVPGFLIAGPVLAIRRLGEKVTVLGARGTCPACTREQEFGVRSRWREELPVTCQACSRGLQLVTEIAGLEEAPGK